MSIEVSTALIGALSALFGAIVGAFASICTTKIQLKATRCQIELDQLRKVESRIETFLQQWNDMMVDASGPVTLDLLASRFTDRFLRRTQLFMGVAHYFPQNLEQNFSSLSKEINTYISTVKTGGTVSSETATDAIKRMQKLEEETQTLAGKRLREIQYEKNNLLSAK